MADGDVKKKPSARLIISRTLIIVGSLLVLLAVGYEAANYPWHTLGVSDRPEWHDPEYLADPPLDDGLQIVPPPSPSKKPAVTPPDSSPSPSAQTPDEPSPDSPLPGDGDSLLPKPKPVVKPDPIGIIKIPKLKQSLHIYEGATLYELSLGVGHVINTAHIGQKGNVCLAGHRSTASMHPFRYLDMIGAGDIIVLKDSEHTYTYTAYEQFIVSESEFNVLHAVKDVPYCLTLITCHPYGFQTHRLIVRASLTDVDGIPAGEFYAEPSPSPDLSPSPEISPSPTPDPSPSPEISPSPELPPDVSASPSGASSEDDTQSTLDTQPTLDPQSAADTQPVPDDGT